MLRLALVALVFGVASASHFRFATISWEKGDGNNVRFTIETAWRRSYDGNVKGHNEGAAYVPGAGSGDDGFPVTGDEIEVNGLEWPTFDTGDGNLSYLTLKVAYYSEAEDWIYGVSTIDHHYKTPSNQGSAWVAKFTGCCRLSNLMNNKDRTWSVQSQVNLMTEEYSAHVKSLPIITVKNDEENAHFYVPATNPNNERNNLKWYLSNWDQMGGTQSNWAHNPEGMSINEDTGEVTFNTKTSNDGKVTTPGLYNAGVVIHSGLATTPVDFLIRVVDAEEGEGMFPESVPLITNPLDNYPNTMSAFVGFEVSFVVKASDSNPEDSVGFTWGVLPLGADLGTVQQQAAEVAGTGLNPVQQQFSWTPCNGQQGVHIVCFEAVDNNAVASTQRCVEIVVQSDPAPHFLSSGPESDSYTGYIGSELQIKVHADDSNCNDDVSIESDNANAACRDANGPWPAGAELGAQISLGGEQTGDDCKPMERVFHWNPRWDQGGWTGDICFAVYDLAGGCDGAGVVQKTRKCVNVVIERCRYTVQYEQQLQEIAAIYATDWITLWMVNREIQHPDYVLHPLDPVLFQNQVVWTGHNYKVNIRDNLYDIAERFGTSVEWLHHMNADLCEDHSVDVGQTICIISNPCDGAVLTPYGKAGAKDNFWYSAAKDAYKRHGTYEEAGVQHTYAPGHN